MSKLIQIGPFSIHVDRTPERTRILRALKEKSRVGESTLHVFRRLKLWNEGVTVRGHVVAVIYDANGRARIAGEGSNLVTDTGDIHYAQRVEEAYSSGPAPTNAFGIMELATAHGGVPAKADNRSAVSGFVASSQKAFDATYPLENDPDGDTPGSGVDRLSVRVPDPTGEANAAGNTEIIITNVTPGASEPILTHADITAFTKTSSDTLKVFVNHTFTGV